MNFLGRGVARLVVKRLAGRRSVGTNGVEPRRFGIEVEDPVCLERIAGILGAFFGGFETGLTGGPPARAGAVGPLLRPFFEEGLAMGFLPNGYLRLVGRRRSLRRFEETLCRPEDPFLFLRYVGLGFWLGFRHPRGADRMDRIAATLAGGRWRHLVHDGYGFKIGFFDFPRAGIGKPMELLGMVQELEREIEEVLEHENLSYAVRLERAGSDLRSALPSRVLEGLRGFERTSALNGLGRSLWFFSMDRPEEGISLARFLASDHGAIVGGMGLAAAFTFVDDLARAYRVADTLQGAEAAQFRKGIRLALYVRAVNDEPFLKECLARQEPAVRERAALDLARALAVGEETRGREDFIEAFHEGCLKDGAAG